MPQSTPDGYPDAIPTYMQMRRQRALARCRAPEVINRCWFLGFVIQIKMSKQQCPECQRRRHRRARFNETHTHSSEPAPASRIQFRCDPPAECDVTRLRLMNNGP